jgi:hypothetical protein
VSDAALTTRLNRGADRDRRQRREEQRLIKHCRARLPLHRRSTGRAGIVKGWFARGLRRIRCTGSALPDKPSIAVLPFSNLSGDPQQEYFADGVVEDIIAEPRLRWLFVIARNSSFVYKGKSVDIKQVGASWACAMC